MTQDQLENEYFEWLYGLICGDRFPSSVSYRKLLVYLHSTPFTYIIPDDENRAENGIDLRYRFAIDQDIANADDYLAGPCSVFEMMAALAIKCEEFMDDPDVGDRTGQWFWGMISNLGLKMMVDSRFDRDYVDMVISKFLTREYDPDGKGGLFTIPNCRYDLRTVEIWCQLCWYLDNFV